MEQFSESFQGKSRGLPLDCSPFDFQSPMLRELSAAEQLVLLWSKHPVRSSHLDAFFGRLGYKFNNIHLALEALTHRSAISDFNLSLSKPNRKFFKKLVWNERLEFLGDSVLGLSVSTSLWEKDHHCQEGILSRYRASLVSEPSLALVARNIKLSDVLVVGRGEEKSGGRFRDSLLADAVEAIIGAVYLDAGFGAAQTVVENLFKDLFDVRKTLCRDHKTRLQEMTQAMELGFPEYRLVDSKGPDHSKEFTVEVYICGEHRGVGSGGSKKRASQLAAKQALEKLKDSFRLLESQE